MKDRIKQIREEAGLSMLAFGNEIGVSSASVCNIENGKRNPSRQTALFICRRFDVREEWLFTGNGPMRNTPETINAMRWTIRELQNDDDTFKKRFLEALSRLPPDQWDMVEQFMLDIIKAKENAPDESPERDDHSDVSSTTM